MHTKKNKGERLCNNLTELTLHEQMIVRTKEERIFAFCGAPCNARCMKCPGAPYIHYNVVRGKNKNKLCFLHYHNNSMFGLGRDNQLLIGNRRCDWVAPTEEQIRLNTIHIDRMEEEYQREHNN